MASGRGLTETTWFRSYNSFQFGSYHHAAARPFGNLVLLNDNTLAGGHLLQYRLEADARVMVLPTVGRLELILNGVLLQTVEAGSCFSFSASADDIISYRNPYMDELINFIQLWLTKPDGRDAELDEVFPQDEINVLGSVNESLCLGRFIGRTKGEYKASGPDKGLYIMVLEGAFEVAERLLESRDALLLEGFEEIDFEALSNEAILLVLEVNLD